MNASTESPLQQTPELLRRLVDAKVELVVIGGVAAVAWGSTQFTRDLDISAPFTLEENAVEVPLFERQCRIIGLDDLITVKTHVRRAKDLVVASELEAVRDERSRKG
jgi:hypothetical protein